MCKYVVHPSEFLTHEFEMVESDGFLNAKVEVFLEVVYCDESRV